MAEKETVPVLIIRFLWVAVHKGSSDCNMLWHANLRLAIAIEYIDHRLTVVVRELTGYSLAHT